MSTKAARTQARTSDETTITTTKQHSGDLKIQIAKPKKGLKSFTLTRESAIDLHELLSNYLNVKDTTWLQ